jgi:hypothetical protein
MKQSNDPRDAIGLLRAGPSLVVALVALALTAIAGCNDCDFWAYCEGNVRVVCGAGVDQQIGRSVQRIPCEAPNPVCVAGGREAVCVRSAEARCPFPSPQRCEGNRKISCEPVAGAGDRFTDAGTYDNRGYEVELDCSSVRDASSDAGPGNYVCMAPSGCVPR